MEDWIAGSFAVLGTLMVLAGATLIVLRTLGRLGGQPQPETDAATAATVAGGSHAAAETEPAGRRFSFRKLTPATQLIGWGILLLVVAAFAVGLISFGVSLEAGTANGAA